MVPDLDLPREAWAAHPRYPHNLLLLRSHDAFHAVGERLVAHARAGASRSAVLAVFAGWKAAMAGHEHYEETKLYPFLEHRWGLRCDALAAGHRALAEADRAVRGAEASDLPAALATHHEVLTEHLDLEEARVIPALLALSEAAFDVYTRGRLPDLLRDVPCYSDAGCRACAPQGE